VLKDEISHSVRNDKGGANVLMINSNSLHIKLLHLPNPKSEIPIPKFPSDFAQLSLSKLTAPPLRDIIQSSRSATFFGEHR
jgi:hypothetical protein